MGLKHYMIGSKDKNSKTPLFQFFWRRRAKLTLLLTVLDWIWVWLKKLPNSLSYFFYSNNKFHCLSSSFLFNKYAIFWGDHIRRFLPIKFQRPFPTFASGSTAPFGQRRSEASGLVIVIIGIFSLCLSYNHLNMSVFMIIEKSVNYYSLDSSSMLWIFQTCFSTIHLKLVSVNVSLPLYGSVALVQHPGNDVTQMSFLHDDHDWIKKSWLMVMVNSYVFGMLIWIEKIHEVTFQTNRHGKSMSLGNKLRSSAAGGC